MLNINCFCLGIIIFLCFISVIYIIMIFIRKLHMWNNYFSIQRTHPIFQPGANPHCHSACFLPIDTPVFYNFLFQICFYFEPCPSYEILSLFWWKVALQSPIFIWNEPIFALKVPIQATFSCKTPSFFLKSLSCFQRGIYLSDF